MDDGIRKRLKKLLDVVGIPDKTASQRAGLGATYVGDVIRRGRGKVDAVEKIVEEISPSYVEWVLKGRGEPPTKEDAPSSSIRPHLKPDIEPAKAAEREAAVVDPSFAAALLPHMARMPILAGKTIEWSEMLVSEVPAELVPRPWFLGESKLSYGLIVGTENMSPIIEPDDLVIVNELLDVRRLREALFCTARENTVFRAILARYIGQSRTHWTIEEASSGTGEAGPRQIAKKDWPAAYPVVAKITRR